MKIADLCVVFISYDEPRREEFWSDLKQKCPTATRVDGVKGIDLAHKTAVQAGTTDHVITVDADNIVDPGFFEGHLDEAILQPGTRVDWPARNVVNGVVSSNGGLKCWPKALVASMRSHESAPTEERSVDFPVSLEVWRKTGPHRVQHTVPMSVLHCNGTPMQALRSSFREAIKLALPATTESTLAASLHPLHRHRLVVWCSVGADAENGLWCLYGARLAIRMLHLDAFDYLAINDFDWFEDFWREEIGPRFAGEGAVCRHSGYGWDQRRLLAEIVALGRTLDQELGLEVAELTADQSRLFKQIYEPPLNLNALDRLGTMFQRGIGVAPDEDRAVRCYEAAARVGHPGALYNLARLELACQDDRSAREQGVALLREASALGNAYAAHRLGRLHRFGRDVARDPALAVRLFELATERGFAAAHRDLAEIYRAGEGVAPDPERAHRHDQMAEAAGRGSDGQRDPARASRPRRPAAVTPVVVRLGDLSAILLSADEPQADAHWRALAAAFPKAIRVHGLQASWSTIRRAAALADTDRFLVVRGDTRIDPALAEHVIDDELIESQAALAWPTRNAVNGLCYAAGAIRCCWRPALLEADAAGAPPEIALPRSFGTSHPNGTPRHAFRAGFREAVAHGLVGGRAPGRPRLASRLPPASLKRLLVWATVGADQDNGLWCLYGARLGCKMAQLDQFDPALLVRPEWLEQLWEGRIAVDFAGQEISCPHSGFGWDRTRLETAVLELGDLLRRELALEIIELDARQSRFLRSVWSRDFDASAFDRLGNLYRSGQILPGDLAKAARNYALGAILGNSNAADNLARMQLRGEGVPKDVEAAVALLAQATSMGSPHAPYHLAQAYLQGAATGAAAAKVAGLLRLAGRRGFLRAHATLAELYRSGRGVPRDPETALVHGLLAGGAGEAVTLALRGELEATQVSRAEQRARDWRDEAGDP